MFAVRTGVRISEAADTQWGEIDFDAKLWTIPAARMKMRKPHVVPLSRQAIELLDELLKIRTGDNVFPSPVGDKVATTLSIMVSSCAALSSNFIMLDIIFPSSVGQAYASLPPDVDVKRTA
jgi:integrase